MAISQLRSASAAAHSKPSRHSSNTPLVPAACVDRLLSDGPCAARASTYHALCACPLDRLAELERLEGRLAVLDDMVAKGSGKRKKSPKAEADEAKKRIDELKRRKEKGELTAEEEARHTAHTHPSGDLAVCTLALALSHGLWSLHRSVVDRRSLPN